MCVVQVGTLVLQRSHKYFELEIFQFYLWSWMLCTSGLADMQHATSPTIDPTRPDPGSNRPNPTHANHEFWNQQNQTWQKRSKQRRYAIDVILIYFNTLLAIGVIPTRFIKSGKFLTQSDTIQSNPWIDLTHDCLWFNPNNPTFVLDFCVGETGSSWYEVYVDTVAINLLI